MAALGSLDIFVIVFSLCAVFGLSLWTTLRGNRSGNAASNYFLAGKNASWWLIAASLFASNIGTEHFVGQAGAAAYSGIVLSWYEWLAAYSVLALGWLFAPVYLRVQLVTIPQFLEERFNKECRGLYVTMLLVLYVMSKIGTSVYAGAVLFEVILGWSLWQSVPVILISTAIYTMGGGLRTVMFTDALQLIIFLTGGLAGTITSLNLVGGVPGLFEKLEKAGLTDAPHMFRSIDDRDYPWLAMIACAFSTGPAYWCIDQEMAQRVLAGKSLSEVRLGTAMAGLLKLLPPFITVFPGMIARALFEMCTADPDSTEFPEWCSAELDHSKNSDHAYPLLIVNNFPSGLKGLMIASFLAAMMSSISSVFNSAATVFTYDVYERIFGCPGGSSPPRLILVGRFLICSMTVLTLCYLPVIQKLDRGLYVLGFMALSHFAPPISAVFIAGIFVKRTNGQGAIAGFGAGALIGFVRFVLSFLFQHECDSKCENHRQHLTWSSAFVCLNFNYFGILLLLFTLSIIYIVSTCYPAPDIAITKSHTLNLSDLLLEKSSAEPRDEENRIRLLEQGSDLPKREGTSNSSEFLKYRAAIAVSIAAMVAVNTCFFIFH